MFEYGVNKVWDPAGHFGASGAKWPSRTEEETLNRACHPGSHYWHYNDVTMSTLASQITSLTIVYSTVYSDADQRKHQSSASLAFVWGIHRGPVNSPHKWPVTRKMFSFDDVIMGTTIFWCSAFKSRLFNSFEHRADIDENLLSCSVARGHGGR